MTEDNNKSEIQEKLLGQIFSFALGITGFGLSAIFVLRGLEAGAIAAALGGIAPIVVAVIANLRK